MKYYEKRKHLILKILAAVIVIVAIFFAVCDCTPRQTSNEITFMYERN